MQSRILYQSETCVVLNKNKGESCVSTNVTTLERTLERTPERSHEGIKNLADKLKTFLDVNFIEAVHRLDVPVTGCCLFALDKKTLVFLNNSFADNYGKPVKKIYWAITEKPSRSFCDYSKLAHCSESVHYSELIHWIETNTQNNKSFAHNKEGFNRKKAVLRYRKIGEGKNYLYFEIDLVTGRHHQIRAQLSAIGLHIKGDLKYGAKRSEKDGGIRLHAHSLSFPDPLNKNKIITVKADPPVIDNLWNDFTACTREGILR